MKLWERALNALAGLLLLLLAVYSLMDLTIYAFGLDCRDWLFLALLPLCLLFWAFFTFRRSRLILAAILGGAAALALWNRGGDFWNRASESIGATLSVVFQCYVRAYDLPFPELARAEGDSTVCLLLLGGLLALYFGWALIAMSRHPLWALGGSALLFAPAAAIHGYPEVLPLAGLLAFWALLLLSASLRRRQDPAAGTLVLALAPVVALLLTAGLMFLRPAEYRPNPHLHAFADRAAALWEETVSAVYSREEAGPAPAQTQAPEETKRPVETVPPGERPDQPELEAPGWQADRATEEHVGQDTSIDLTELGPLRQSLVNVMRVQSDRSGTTYLRGVSMGDYTGDRWEPAERFVSPASYSAGSAALAAGGQTEQMQIHMLQFSTISYLPYYYVQPPRRYQSDTSVLLEGKEREYVFYDGPVSALVETGSDTLVPNMKEYRDHAREVYLQLPETTKTALLSLAAEAGLTGEGVDLIEQVAVYVQNAAVYETEMAPFPAGSDYAVYFLTEAKAGYCVHFATAATALYRALGIPARLVSGFVVETKAGEWVNVSGKHAHAWVEVYLDGVGWVPVEVTGVVGGTDPDAPENEPMKPPVGFAGQDEDKTAPLPGWVKTALKALAGVLGLAAAAGLILLRRKLVLYWRARRFGDPDTNRAAVRLRQFARKLEDRGVPFPEELEELAQRACFGQRPVDPEELERCRAQVEAGLQALVEAAPKWKRIWLRFGPCLE